MANEKIDLFTLRKYEPDDKNFILATLLRGLYFGSPFFNQIPKNIFMENYHTIAEKHLESGRANVIVACLKDDPSVILGYSISHYFIGGQFILDYVFVKSAWRRIGIARSLLPAKVDAVTHLTKLGAAIKPKEWVFNPFLI